MDLRIRRSSIKLTCPGADMLKAGVAFTQSILSGFLFSDLFAEFTIDHNTFMADSHFSGIILSKTL
jgi:hypothetical protein